MTSKQPTVRTNNQWRDFLYRDEAPESVLEDDLDWTDEDNVAGYIHYNGVWYHLSQFIRGGIPGWDGAAGDSYFSGVVVRLSRDGEQYQIGTYFA